MCIYIVTPYAKSDEEVRGHGRTPRHLDFLSLCRLFFFFVCPLGQLCCILNSLSHTHTRAKHSRHTARGALAGGVGWKTVLTFGQKSGNTYRPDWLLVYDDTTRDNPRSFIRFLFALYSFSITLFFSTPTDSHGQSDSGTGFGQRKTIRHQHWMEWRK